MTAQSITLDSRVRSILVLIPGLFIAMWVASQLASDDSIVPVLFIVLFIALACFALFARQIRFEAAVISFLLAGYLVGNRGFADVTVAKPFFFGEVGFALVAVSALIRYAVMRESLNINDILARSILVFLFVGGCRLALDFQTYKLEAIRDSAMVYYAAFFFTARQLETYPGSLKFIEKVIMRSLLGLVGVAFLLRVKPEYLEDFSFGPYSPLVQKDDLTTTFAAAGVYFLFLHQKFYKLRWLRVVTIVFFMVFIVNGIGRAALVGLLAASVLLFIAGQRRFFWYPAVATIVGITVLAGFSTQIGDSTASSATRMQEKIVSIVDFTGSLSNRNSDLAELKAGTNEFRRTLWATFAENTLHDAPVFGEGFGHDFISTFEDTYLLGDFQGLRSAHNYYVTAFGRMGFVGLLVLMAITWQILVGGVRAAQAVRAGWMPKEDLAYWCGAWAILVSAVFGVVLEGPVGGIVFWIFLGLATATYDRAKKQHEADSRTFYWKDKVLEKGRVRMGRQLQRV